MKTSLGFRGLFLLLSLMWTYAGNWSAIHVQCTQFWFFARIKPTIFHNFYVNPDEVFLGDGCPVTDVSPGVYYEFFYYLHDCGIRTLILQETLLLKTKIKYVSRNSTVRSEIPLSCVIHCGHHNLIEVQNRENETGTVTEQIIELKLDTETEDNKAIPAMWLCNPNVTNPCLPNGVPGCSLRYSEAF